MFFLTLNREYSTEGIAVFETVEQARAYALLYLNKRKQEDHERHLRRLYDMRVHWSVRDVPRSKLSEYEKRRLDEGMEKLRQEHPFTPFSQLTWDTDYSSKSECLYYDGPRDDDSYFFISHSPDPEATYRTPLLGKEPAADALIQALILAGEVQDTTDGLHVKNCDVLPLLLRHGCTWPKDFSFSKNEE